MKTSRVYPSKKERMKQKSKQSSGRIQPPPPGYVNFPVPAELLNQTQPVTYTVTISPANKNYPTQDTSQSQQPFYQPQDSMPSYIPIYFQADQSGYPPGRQQVFTTAPPMGTPIRPAPMNPPNVPMPNLIYVPGEIHSFVVIYYLLVSF